MDNKKIYVTVRVTAALDPSNWRNEDHGIADIELQLSSAQIASIDFGNVLEAVVRTALLDLEGKKQPLKEEEDPT